MRKSGKISTADEAFDCLRNEILHDQLKSEQRLSTPNLAARFGLDPSQVHETLLRLADDGLVDQVSEQGARVLPISVDAMREIYEILGALEPQAANSLASAGLSREQLAKLEQATIDMEKALEQEDLDAWADADARFHAELLRLQGNSRMSSIIRSLSDQAHRARLSTIGSRKPPVRSTFEHRAIFDAILRGDAELARDSYARHRERSAAELLALLAKKSH